jgi:flagellar biosynthesis repressor protein FlbT
MPLSIHLKPRERLVLNGVVIENSGTSAKILIHNNAALLREKDMITEACASTPARRLYYALQCRYLYPETAGVDAAIIVQRLDELAAALPGASALVADIRREVASGDLYRALKAARQLIRGEAEATASGSSPADGAGLSSGACRSRPAEAPARGTLPGPPRPPRS